MRGMVMDNFNRILFLTFLFAVFVLFSVSGWQTENARSAEQSKYVGSEGCKECHADEYRTFKQFNKKAHSFQSIIRLQKGLEEAELRNCYECHTTGYGKEGGFRSEQETPALKDAGCEVCHGPGSIHAETGDPKDIKGKLTAKDCELCHNSERIDAFKYKPLVYGGAH
jgi:hypothetical protein